MATNLIHKQLNPSAATLSDLYTVPGSTQTVVSSVTVCNRSATATSFRFVIRPSGNAVSNEMYTYYDRPIGGNDTFAWALGQTLPAAAVVSVYATLATLSFQLNGQENS